MLFPYLYKAYRFNVMNSNGVDMVVILNVIVLTKLTKLMYTGFVLLTANGQC
jgi:hypothetical protein